MQHVHQRSICCYRQCAESCSGRCMLAAPHSMAAPEQPILCRGIHHTCMVAPASTSSKQVFDAFLRTSRAVPPDRHSPVSAGKAMPGRTTTAGGSGPWQTAITCATSTSWPGMQPCSSWKSSSASSSPATSLSASLALAANRSGNALTGIRCACSCCFWQLTQQDVWQSVCIQAIVSCLLNA